VLQVKQIHFCLPLGSLTAVTALDKPPPAADHRSAAVSKESINALKQEMFALNSAGKVAEAGKLRKRIKEMEAQLDKPTQVAAAAPQPPPSPSPPPPLPPPHQQLPRAGPSQLSELEAQGPLASAAAPVSAELTSVAAVLAQANALSEDTFDGNDDGPDDMDDPELLGRSTWSRSRRRLLRLCPSHVLPISKSSFVELLV
jgi:hypothetical protein